MRDEWHAGDMIGYRPGQIAALGLVLVWSREGEGDMAPLALLVSPLSAD